MSYSNPVPPPVVIPADGMALPLGNAAITGSARLDGDALLTVADLRGVWQEWGETLTEKIQAIVRGGAAPPVEIPVVTDSIHNKVMIAIKEARDVDVFGTDDGTVSVFDPAGLVFPDGTPCTRAHVKKVGFNRSTIMKRFSHYEFGTYVPPYGLPKKIYLFGEFKANIVGVSGGYARAEYYTRRVFEQWEWYEETPQYNSVGEEIEPLITKRWNYQGAEFEYYAPDGILEGYLNRLDPDDVWPYHFMDAWATPSLIPVLDIPDYLKQPDTFRAFAKPETGPKPYPGFDSAGLCTHRFPLMCWAILVNE